MNAVNIATFLLAVAASVAVVLGAANLYFTGRREHLSWARSVLEAAFVEFLTASYENYAACKGLACLQQGLESNRSEQAWRESADQTRAVMINCITRFRVLVSDEMAESAIRLRQHNDKDMEMINSGEGAAFLRERKRHMVFDPDRDVFIKMAKGVLRVR